MAARLRYSFLIPDLGSHLCAKLGYSQVTLRVSASCLSTIIPRLNPAFLIEGCTFWTTGLRFVLSLSFVLMLTAWAMQPWILLPVCLETPVEVTALSVLLFSLEHG
jgi:hypothetical protein